MFWKKTGLICVVISTLGIVTYAQTTKPRARSTSLQGGAGYLGVGVQNLKDSSGILVTLVVPGEAGERAGIHERDVILEFDGQKVESDADFTARIVSKAPGTKVNFAILRNSSKQNIVATLGMRPPDLPLNTLAIDPRMTPEQIRGMIAAAGAMSAPRVGFDCVEMMPQLAAYFGVREGLLVESVEPGTPAHKAGLKAGDVIVKVNGIPVSMAREIGGIIRLSGNKIIGFTVFRNKKEMTLNIEMAWLRPDQAVRDSVN